MSARLVLQKCLDCKREFASTGTDALCSPCRLANTARNMARANCACGKPLRTTGKYRSPLCDDCENERMNEDIRKWGSG